MTPNNISRTLAILSVLAAVPVAAEGLRISATFPLAAPAVEPAPFQQRAPRVASNGEAFLAVWSDDRSQDGTREIRGARIASDGQFMDRGTGILVGVLAQGGVAVASDGRDYVVAFECVRASSMAVCLVRVDSTTGLVTAGSIVQNASFPAIASNGRSYLVGYLKRNPGDVNGSLELLKVSPDATTSSAPTRVGDAFPAAIASNGRDYLAVWSAYSGLRTALVTEEAAIARRGLAPVESMSMGPSAFSWTVGSDGKDFLVVWQQNRGVVERTYTTDLRSSIVSAEGVPEAAMNVVASEAERAWFPAVAWDGAQYVLAYSGLAERNVAPYVISQVDGDLYRTRLTRSGAVAREAALVAGRRGLEGPVDIAIADGGTLAVWERTIPDRASASEIEARLLDTTERFTVSRSLSWQQSITGAVSGDRNIVVWEEIVGDEQQRKLFIQRVDGSGVTRDGRGLAISAATNDQVHPSASHSMVAWLDQARMSGSFAFAASRMLNADGFPGTTVLFGAAMRDSRISVASRGNEHLVVWESPEGDILGTRVSATGTKLDANPIVVSRGARGWSPAVTTDGVDYQVVWNQPETLPIICVMTCPQVASLQGALVSGSGALAAQVKIAAARIFPSNPAVVWNGSEFAVFWSGAGIASEISVDAWRISRVGLPLEGPVKVGRVASVDGAASSAGGYLVALTDRATSAATLVRLDANFVRVDDIVLSDRQTPAAPNAMSVAILPQQDGSTLIAHRTISDEVSRAVGSLVAPSASPAQSGGRRRSVRGG